MFRVPGKLEFKGKEIPLHAAAILVTIIDFTAKVRIQQLFRHKEESPIEVIYTFPVGKRQTLLHFKYLLSGEKTKIDVPSRAEVFQQAIPNVPRKTTLEIDLTYTWPLNFTP